jgi:hypothetical protein
VVLRLGIDEYQVCDMNMNTEENNRTSSAGRISLRKHLEPGLNQHHRSRGRSTSCQATGCLQRLSSNVREAVTFGPLRLKTLVFPALRDLSCNQPNISLEAQVLSDRARQLFISTEMAFQYWKIETVRIHPELSR